MLFFLFAFCFLIVMPTVLGSLAIVTEHRRKMAELRVRAGTDVERVAALERRVGDLSALVHEQTIALDGMVGTVRIERERAAVSR